mgnify:CR=1 FL=1
MTVPAPVNTALEVLDDRLRPVPAGLAGHLEAGQLSLLAGKPQGLRGVTNPLPPAGGADAEALEDARRNAPMGVMTLGRVVSLQDYEDFARSFAAVAKARADFPTMAAVEMEGAAIAQVCHQFGVPFVVTRSLSDIAGKESPDSFDAYLEIASRNSSAMVIAMLKRM